jgi:hypothetical protein
MIENFYATYDYALDYGYGFPYDSPESCKLDGSGAFIESIGDKCLDGGYFSNSCFNNDFGAGVEQEYARRYFRLKVEFKKW